MHRRTDGHAFLHGFVGQDYDLATG